MDTLNKFLYIIGVLFLFGSCSKNQKVISLSKEQRKEANDQFFAGLQDKNAEKWESAVQHFSQYLTILPNEPSAHYESARILRERMYSPVEALQHAEIAVGQDPDNKWYLLELARCQMANNTPKAAVKTYEKAADLDPSWTLVLSEWAESSALTEDYKGAIAVWNRLEKVSGVDPYITNQKQSLYFQMNDQDAAGLELEKLAAAFPQEKQWVIQAAEYYTNIGKPDKANAVLEKFPIPNSGISYYLQYKSAVKSQKGNPYEHLQLLEKACAFDDVSIDQRVVALAPLVYQSFPAEWNVIIESCITQTMNVFPNEAKAFSLAGDFYNNQNNLEKAKACFQKTLTLNPSESAVWKALLEIFEIQISLDPAAYLHTAQEASSQFPFMPEFKAHEVVALSRSGEYEALIDAADAGLAIVIDQVEAEAALYINKIQGLYALGRKEEAVQISKNALQLPQLQIPIIIFQIEWLNEFFEGNNTIIRDRYYNALNAQQEGSLACQHIVAIRKNETLNRDTFQTNNWQDCLNGFYYFKKLNQSSIACEFLEKAENILPYNPWIPSLHNCP